MIPRFSAALFPIFVFETNNGRGKYYDFIFIFETATNNHITDLDQSQCILNVRGVGCGKIFCDPDPIGKTKLAEA